MNEKKFNLLLGILLVSNLIYSQDNHIENSWLLSIDLGIQLSGIKSEDFLALIIPPYIGYPQVSC